MSSSEKTLAPSLVSYDSSGTITARHYQTGLPLRIVWRDNILTSVEPGHAPDADDLWIAPGLIDLQINGYAGVDFQQAPTSVTEENLLKATRRLREDGCSRILLTLITAPWEQLKATISAYRAIIRHNPELHRAIPGWHIEGPFLSDQPGYSGAHNPAWMTDPTPEQIRELKELVGADPLLLTLAPERNNSAAAIREAVRCGFVVSAGHSNAGAQHLHASVEAGLSAYTHLGNGCAQQLDRHDNILWRVLDEPALIAGLIPDGIHVSPMLFRLFHRALTPDRIYWTTDAMAAAGAPNGLYSIGSMEVMVGSDRVVRNPVTNGFAGSALEPIEGIRRGADMLRTSWRDVWNYFSINPAKLMHLPGDLTPGSTAGFCLIRES